MFSKPGVDRLLNAVAPDAVSLHTALPNASGSNEATGGSYARGTIVFPVASNGTRLWTGNITIQVPAGTYRFLGLWQGSEFVAYSALGSDGEYDILRAEADGKFRTADFQPTIGTTVTFFGTVPTGITAGDLYYVVSAGTDAGGFWFRVSATSNGSAITFTAFTAQDCQVSKFSPQGFSKAGKINLRTATLTIRTGTIADSPPPPPTGYRWLETFNDQITLTPDAPVYDLSQQISDPANTTSYSFEVGDEIVATNNGITLDANTGDLTWDGVTGAGTSVQLRIYASNDQPVVVGPEFFEEGWTDSQLRPDDSFVSGFNANDWATGPFYVKWNTPGGDIVTSDATAYGGTVNGRWATCTLTPAEVGSTYTFDVTNLIRAIARTNNGELTQFRNLGFFIKARYTNADAQTGNASGSIKFASRVNPTVSYRPKIVITGTAGQTIYATSAGPILKNPAASAKPLGYGEDPSGLGLHYIGMANPDNQNLILWFDLAALDDPADITTANLVLTGYPEPIDVTNFDAATGTVTAPGHVFAANSTICFTSPVPTGLVANTTYYVAQTYPESVVLGTSFKLATSPGVRAFAVTSFAADGTITCPGHNYGGTVAAPVATQIKFQGSPLPPNITAGTTYFVRNFQPTTGTRQSFQISATATGQIITFPSPVATTSAYVYTGAGPVTSISFGNLSTSTTKAYRFRSVAGVAELYRVNFPLLSQSVTNMSPNETGIAWEVPDDNGLGNHPDVYFFDRCYDNDWFNRGANVVNGKKVRVVNGTTVIDRTAAWKERSFYADIKDPNWAGPNPAGPANNPTYDGNITEGNDTQRGFLARWPGHRYVSGKWFGFSDETFPLKPTDSKLTFASAIFIDASGLITTATNLPEQISSPKPADAIPGATVAETGDWGVPVSLKGNWPAPFKHQTDLSATGYWAPRAYYIDPVSANSFRLRATLYGPVITPTGGARTLTDCRVYVSDGVDASGALKGQMETTPYPTMRDELYVRGYFANNEGFIQDMQACKQLIGMDSLYDTVKVGTTQTMGEANSGAIVNGFKGFSFRLHSEHPSGFINMRSWASLTDSPYYSGAMHHLYREGYDQWTAYAYVVDAANETGYDIFLDTNDDVAYKMANQAVPGVYPAPNASFGLSGPPSALNYGNLGWLKRNRFYCVEQYCKINGLVPNPLYNPVHAQWAATNLGAAFGRYPYTMMSPIGLPAGPSGVPGTGNWSNGMPCMAGGNVDTATTTKSADGRMWISDGGKRDTQRNTWKTGEAGRAGAFLTASGFFNLFNAFWLRDFRQAFLERSPFMPDRNNLGIYRVWIEGKLAFNYTGWWGRATNICTDGVTPYGINGPWLCAQSGGVNRFSGDHAPGAYGAMSNVVVSKRYVGPRRNP